MACNVINELELIWRVTFKTILATELSFALLLHTIGHYLSDQTSPGAQISYIQDVLSA